MLILKAEKLTKEYKSRSKSNNAEEPCSYGRRKA